MATVILRSLRTFTPRLHTRPLLTPNTRSTQLNLHTPLFSTQYLQRRCLAGPAAGGGNDYQLGPSNELQPQPNTQQLGYIAIAKQASGNGGDEGGEGGGGKDDGKGGKGGHSWKQSGWKVFEAAATTGMSLAVLG